MITFHLYSTLKFTKNFIKVIFWFTWMFCIAQQDRFSILFLKVHKNRFYVTTNMFFKSIYTTHKILSMNIIHKKQMVGFRY